MQFRSISYGLFGTEAYHKAVRRKAVHYLREHRSDFEGFLGDDFDSWLKEMSHNDSWGDELTLVSLSVPYVSCPPVSHTLTDARCRCMHHMMSCEVVQS